MQAASSPAPDFGGGIKQPGPAIVPTPPAKKKRTAMWGVLVAVVVLAGAGFYYKQSQAQSKTNNGGTAISVATVAVGMGDLSATLRVNGTVAAQNFAALLAPRIQGSRSGINRGGDNNFG